MCVLLQRRTDALRRIGDYVNRAGSASSEVTYEEALREIGFVVREGLLSIKQIEGRQVHEKAIQEST